MVVINSGKEQNYDDILSLGLDESESWTAVAVVVAYIMLP